MEIHSDPLLTPLEKTVEGVRIGECVIVSKLGAGGMGAVYLGHHLSLDIDVAVKVLPFQVAEAHATAVERFQKEARATVRIDHPNIVRVFHVGDERTVHYLVMEFVDGESASARLEREGALHERDALEVAIATGEALSAAHDEGILHRDVKPANILIRYRDGRVKLADLGLAKALGGEKKTGLTATGQMLGTPAYMSPEQAVDASRSDERTDIYSLGATLYAFLSGRAPYEASQLYSLLNKVVNEDPEDLRILRPEVTERTAEALKELMAKDPGRRPPRMRDAVELLRACLEGAPAEGARGLARPEMAGKSEVKVSADARVATAAPTAAAEATLEDVTPWLVAREHRAATAAGAAAVPLAAGKKVLIAVGVLAALGAALGAGGYLYARRKTERARVQEIARLVAAASAAEKAVELETALSRLEKAAELGDEDAGAEVLRVRRIIEETRRAEEEERNKREAERDRKEEEAKLASLLASARTFRREGLLEKARERLTEVLAVSPDSAEAKRELREVRAEIDRKRAEAERAGEYKKWTDEALKLRLSGRFGDAAQAYTKATEFAHEGSREAADAVLDCMFRHYGKEAKNAEARGDYEGAIGLYVKALEKKDDPATQAAIAAAKKKLEARRVEEERKAEAARWVSRAEEAEKKGELKSALQCYREAAEFGAEVREKIASLEKEQRYEAALARARALVAQEAWKDAAEELERLLRVRPKDSEAAALLIEAKKHLGGQARIAVDLGGGLKMEMVYVGPGNFTMGYGRGEADELPAHEVVITHGFYIGLTEVTNAQYEKFDPLHREKRNKYSPDDDSPVVQVIWDDAAKFCTWLTQRTGHTSRLPTEAEWEYAARGTDGRVYPWGAAPPTANSGRANLAWGKKQDSWAADGHRYAASAGSFPGGVSPFGLFDMIGNVCEWCSDWYGPYQGGRAHDPTGPVTGEERVRRGASFQSEPAQARASRRSRKTPTTRSSVLGFRVVREE